MVRRFNTRAQITGEIKLPAVPSMLEHYVSMCDNVFRGLGKPFNGPEIDQLREALRVELSRAYAESLRSHIVISYRASIGSALDYTVRAQWASVAQAYESWIETRQPPYFGTEPDARVWDLAAQVADPAVHRILEIGGGTGRNALALARRGHPVDVVEMTPKFAAILQSEAEAESLNVRVLVRDVFADAQDLREDYQMMILSEVMTDFRSVAQVRGIFEIAARCLAPGGLLVFNNFLAHEAYQPDNAAREFCQHVYSGMFTRSDMSTAAAGLPLRLVSDESVYDYEKAHLPAEAWPPTSWYADWVRGFDAFLTVNTESPIELRWLVYERTH